MTKLMPLSFSIGRIIGKLTLLAVAMVWGTGTLEAQWDTSSNDIYNTNSGNVGIGISSPPHKLSVSGNLGISESGGGCCRLTISTGGSGTYMNHNDNSPIFFQTEGNTWMTILNSGNVGVGTGSPSSKFHVVGNTTITGDITVSGNISAKYQDLAEWVPAARPIEAGSVVIVDASVANSVLPSGSAYDTRVAGVISAQPGIVLGEKAENKVKVATTGRVKVRVDATKHPIRIGDLLVSAEKSGMAMKSEPVNFGGVDLHRPGTLIGKALEPLSEGEGEILVLLSLQ